MTPLMSFRDAQEAEIDAFLALWSPPISALADRLRALIKQATPHAVERLRPGWRLIGYDLPVNKRCTYFAWVFPEPGHVHVGWQTGTLMQDPDQVLRGAHLKLKKVRYLTFVPGDRIPAKVVRDFTRDAARIASMSRGERELIAATRSHDMSIR